MAKYPKYQDERSEYEAEKDANEYAFKKLLKDVRPDLYVLMDMLDTTKVNPYIIFHVVRSLYAIMMGSKYGNVTVQVENGQATFVRGEESTRIAEKVIKDSE